MHKGMRHSDSMSSLSAGLIDLGGLLRNNSRDDLVLAGSLMPGDDGLMGLTRAGSNESLSSLVDSGLGEPSGLSSCLSAWAPTPVKSDW